MARQLFKKVGQQMLTKLGQQMLTKIDRQLFHTIATDGRLAGAKQQMFLTYTIDYVTPGRFFCLAWYCQYTHYSRDLQTPPRYKMQITTFSQNIPSPCWPLRLELSSTLPAPGITIPLTSPAAEIT